RRRSASRSRPRSASGASRAPGSRGRSRARRGRTTSERTDGVNLERERRSEQLFQAASDLEPAAREEFLRRECAGDAELSDSAAALLRRSRQQTPLYLKALVAPSRRREPDPERIGRYRIVKRIGEGGMGVVYLAEQTEPVRRTVALKVIRAGLDTQKALARFEAERQALALMDHPNIARIHDAGATEAGRPFYGMGYTPGQALTAWCDSHRLGVEERLRLFVPVCEAVQHAHQRGVIHRDLKPSNVLVCETSGTPAPKVIDFGIARPLDKPGAEEIALT